MYATFDNEHGQNKDGIGLGLNICNELTKIIGTFLAIIIHYSNNYFQLLFYIIF